MAVSTKAVLPAETTKDNTVVRYSICCTYLCIVLIHWLLVSGQKTLTYLRTGRLRRNRGHLLRQSPVVPVGALWLGTYGLISYFYLLPLLRLVY